MEEVAGRLIGLPFRFGGREVPDGLDCWGVVNVIYRDAFGVALPDYKHLSTDGPERTMRASGVIESDKVGWREVKSGCERPGDVVLFRRFGLPLHVGVVMGSGRMIHSDVPAGVVQARYDGATWAHRILGFYRHPRLT